MRLLEELDRTRDETLRCFELGPRELDLAYAPGKWTVRYLLHHLADSELVLAERIRRVISEGRRVLWAFEQDAWAERLDYASMPLPLARDLFAATRAATRHLATVHYERHGHLEWVHSEMGVRTLKEELDKVASHNEHHLAQIRAALRTAPA